ncbi:MAG: Hsp20/alpha crystallin family protein [Planctomycetes bacterium]|nr:Hsp20/alpha crystallin family protein [Planctomycetota bacterium]
MKMTQIKRQPGKVTNQFRQELERVFEQYSGVGQLQEALETQADWLPYLDLTTNDRDMVAKIELPGVNPKDVVINISEDILAVSGEKKPEMAIHEENYVRQERPFGMFHRVLRLPSFADPDKTTAECIDGVLSIRIGKAETAHSRRVPIAQMMK